MSRGAWIVLALVVLVALGVGVILLWPRRAEAAEGPAFEVGADGGPTG